MNLKFVFPFIAMIFLSLISVSQSGNWSYVNNGSNCQSNGSSGSCCDGRHEASYVQLGDKFYLLGGRENNGRVNIYDPSNDSWTIGATPPIKLHHFQAVEYHGLMLIAGAMTGNYPAEPSVGKIMIYDPVSDAFLDGPNIPEDRVRGGAGCTVYNGEIYIVSGTTSGHQDGGHVRWVDKYNPETDTWAELSDAPRARDHFQVDIIDGKLYAAAGRRSGSDGVFNGTVAELDEYNIASGNWQDLQRNIPTERAGNTVAVLNDELIIIGGEREAGLAKSEVEAFDPSTQSWRSLTSLNTGRHGTQAIVNNGNIWLASGSPNRGGGNVKSQERFTFGSLNSPSLFQIIKSDLGGSGNVEVSDNQEVTITNENGNQAIIIQNIEFSGNSGFSYDIDTNLPFILKPGNSYTINVSFDGSNDSATGTLQITHSGNGGEKQISLSVAANQLPAPWQTIDIGNVSVEGGVSYENGTYTISGSGEDIWGTSDAFRFIYQTLEGDGEIIAKVNSLSNEHTWSKTGVMIRESLTAGAKHAMTVVRPENGIAFQRRTLRNSRSYNYSVGGITSPVWLKVSREGDEFRSFYSLNGTKWFQVGNVKTVVMASSAYIGIPVTSHKVGTLAMANISDVSITEGVSTGEVINLAFQKNTDQSSTADGGLSSRAVDGDVNGIWSNGSITNTSDGIGQWWLVDLGTQYLLEDIVIYNRIGCCVNRLGNFTVSVSESINGNPIWSQTITAAPFPDVILDVKGITGRYVRVTQNLNFPLTLAEVEVNGFLNSNAEN